MNREDIIRMAQEAKLLGEFDTEECIVQSGIEIWLFGERGINELTQFAALVASAEREACAKIAEIPDGEYEVVVTCGTEPTLRRIPKYLNWQDIVKAIRARGQA